VTMNMIQYKEDEEDTGKQKEGVVASTAW
jgi:hypothetical protein